MPATIPPIWGLQVSSFVVRTALAVRSASAGVREIPLAVAQNHHQPGPEEPRASQEHMVCLSSC